MIENHFPPGSAHKRGQYIKKYGSLEKSKYILFHQILPHRNNFSICIIQNIIIGKLKSKTTFHQGTNSSIYAYPCGCALMTGVCTRVFPPGNAVNVSRKNPQINIIHISTASTNSYEIWKQQSFTDDSSK